MRMEYPKFEELSPSSCREVSIQIHYPEFWSYLHTKYDNLGITFAEMIYLFYHNLSQPSKCVVCGGKTKFIGYTKGYREFCSYGCMNKCKDIQERKKLTSLKNYGTTSPMKCDEVKQKVKDTCIDRYGVENAFQSKQFKDKIKKTCLKKYGTEYANQSESVKQKIWESKCHIAHEKFDDILDVKIGDEKGSIYVMKCPDNTCNLCESKTYEIRSDVLRSRLMLHTDTCTNRYPVGSHIKNTSLEKFVHELLDINHISYETNNRKILFGKELDIYIPDHNLAIECNGVYWHATYDSKYHYDKWKQCHEQDIQLLSIWEDWITNKPEIVKSIILSKLGIYQQRIGASKCNVKKVDSVTARKFLDDNHIQGFCNSTLRYGLYYKDDLMAIMCFKKVNNPAVLENKGWELIRFCNKLNTQIIGGAERLLKHFLNEYDEDVISFASHDISNGSLYEKLGFEYSGEIMSSYWYVHNQSHKRFHRSNFMKKELVKMGYDPSMTEEQIMMSTDYLRIYDSGMSKYILKKTSK